MKKKIKDLNFEEIISIHNLSFCNECPLKNNNGDCIRTGVTYNFSTEFLEKEIEIAGSPLSECIKEWESRGWIVKILNDGKLIDIVNSTKLLAFQIDLKNKKYIKVDSVIYSSGKSITFEEHHLLSKTIKALEEMKNE